MIKVLVFRLGMGYQSTGYKLGRHFPKQLPQILNPERKWWTTATGGSGLVVFASIMGCCVDALCRLHWLL